MADALPFAEKNRDHKALNSSSSSGAASTKRTTLATVCSRKTSPKTPGLKGAGNIHEMFLCPPPSTCPGSMRMFGLSSPPTRERTTHFIGSKMHIQVKSLTLDISTTISLVGGELRHNFASGTNS